MPSAEEYIKRAGNIADQGLHKEITDQYMTINFKSEIIEQIEQNLKNAIELDPNNPEYHYWAACTKIARAQGKTGLELVRQLAELYPDNVEFEGVGKHPEQWFSPFYYPSWHEDQKELPPDMQDIPSGGMSLVSLRDTCRRVVSFFRFIENDSLKPSIIKKANPDIALNYMETPFGRVVGAYVLLSLGNGEIHVSETIVNVDSCPSSLQDMSNAGYWFMRLLAQQQYTFIIFFNSEYNILFNRKLYFKSVHKRTFTEIREKIEAAEPITQWDQLKFQKAQKYYIENCSLDDIIENSCL